MDKSNGNIDICKIENGFSPIHFCKIPILPPSKIAIKNVMLMYLPYEFFLCISVKNILILTKNASMEPKNKRHHSIIGSSRQIHDTSAPKHDVSSNFFCVTVQENKTRLTFQTLYKNTKFNRKIYSI